MKLELKKCSDKRRCLKYHFYDECPFAFNEKRCPIRKEDLSHGKLPVGEVSE